MNLPVPRPLAPMEARTADELPAGDAWLYEPKWDGFRCLVFRDGADVELQSKSQKPLGRYFPEVLEAVARLRPRRFALDGELVIPDGDRTDFDALLQRIHPAESRIAKLSKSRPARLVVFDLLATGARTSHLDRPLRARRESLKRWAATNLGRSAGNPGDAPGASIHVSPATTDRARALRWLETLRGIDGVVAKDLSRGYLPGSRDGVVKVKRLRTADCVVGGYREWAAGTGVGSLLLGLYDDDGVLHHVGFTSGLSDRQRERVMELVRPLAAPSSATGAGTGFTGNAPGGPNRWTGGREKPWIPLRPELVVEVSFDQVTNRRFRHGTRLLRWRPDKDPRACTLEQIERSGAGALRLLG